MMNTFNLVEINDKDLPDINLTEEQKRRIKTVIKFAINPYLKNNFDNVNADFSLRNIIRIVNNLGDEADDILNYARNGKVLRDIVIERLDKDCPIPKDKLIYKTLLYSFNDYTFKALSIGFSKQAIAYRVYVTEDKLLFYNLDNYFRVIDTTTIPIKYIKTAFISNKSIRDFMEFSRNTLFIEFNKLGKNDLSIPKKYMLIGSIEHNDEDLNNFLEVLKSLKVENHRKTKFPYGKILFWISNIFFGVTFIYVLINIFLGSYH